MKKLVERFAQTTAYTKQTHGHTTENIVHGQATPCLGHIMRRDRFLLVPTFGTKSMVSLFFFVMAHFSHFLKTSIFVVGCTICNC